MPAKARFIGNASAASIMRARCQGPGVQVVAAVPVAGPVPPPIIMVMPEFSASSICCGQMKWMWLSMPPAVRILPSPAIASVPGPMMMSTPGCTSGLPALPMPTMRPSRRPTSALTMPVWSMISALVMTVSTAPSARAGLGLAHAVADHLAAAELHLLAVDGEVLLHLDDEVGVGEPHLVADGGAEHVGVGGAGDLRRHVASRLPAMRHFHARSKPASDVHQLADAGTDATSNLARNHLLGRRE